MDTNVTIVANRRHGEPITCANACAQALVLIKTAGVLLHDAGGKILAEYRRYLSLSGQPGVGDSFVKWVHDSAGRPDLVLSVAITPKEDDPDNYEEFPTRAALAGFDRSDRKFVAVALRHAGRPPILNATDRDWLDYRDALAEVGVTVRFLCPEQLGGRTDREPC